MSVLKHLQILGLEVYKIEGIKIVSAASEEWDYLPEWIIDSKGHIVDRDEWKEEVIPEVTYLCVDKSYADPLLAEEIANAGLDDTMKDVSLSQVIDKVPYNKRDGSIGPVARIAVELTYRCDSGWEGDYDCDIDIVVVGYINDKLELIKINSSS